MKFINLYSGVYWTLNNNKHSNIIENKYCILCVKNYFLKILEDIIVEILQSRNFQK